MSGEADKIVIRPMDIHDVPQVHAIEQVTFTMPWSMVAFQYEILNNHLSKYFVMVVQEDDGPMPLPEKIIGYMGFWFVIDEAHITTFSIAKDYQGRGYGKKLMAFALETASLNQIENITLEVRVSNEKALGLYKKFGFKEAGLRRKYYTDNDEDALVMWLHMNENQTNQNEINQLGSNDEVANKTVSGQDKGTGLAREDKSESRKEAKDKLRTLLDKD